MSGERTVTPPKRERASTSTRILLAEDDSSVARALARVIGADGHEVVVAADGQAAAEMLMHEPFDLVVSDVRMPGMTGVELATMVRTYGLDVPVVLLSGDAGRETATAARESGAAHYMTKPIDTRALRSVIARVMPMATMALGANAGRLLDREALEQRFERALESLWIAFQPIVAPRARTIVAYEALVRTNEPSMTTPAALIEAAEQLDRMREVGRLVRARAAESFAEMSGELLFVNVHPFELLDSELYDANAPLSLIAHRVVLEITERANVSSITDLKRRLAVLRFLGFRIAIDDAGANAGGGVAPTWDGLDPEYVKLHMSLVRDIHASPEQRRMVKAISNACRDFGMKLIATGVEGARERDTLLAFGCHLMQGFFFARPGPAFPTARFGAVA